MVHTNTPHGSKYLDLFLKNLPLHPYTEYVLCFEARGGPCSIWLNGLCVEKWDGEFNTAQSDGWLPYTVRFKTGGQMRKAPNWCISFNKQPSGWPVTGWNDTFLDNIHLFKADEPDTDLITGGDFEAPRDDEIYEANWNNMFFGEAGAAYGVDIVEDPQGGNRCLRLPCIAFPPTYPDTVPLRAHSFGWYKALENRTHLIDTAGQTTHQLIIVKSGCVDGTAGDQAVSAPKGTVLYVPPHTPVDLIYQKGADVTYHWVTFDGEPTATLLAGVLPEHAAVLSVSSPATLSTHIDAMLDAETMRTDPIYPYLLSSRLQLLIGELKKQVSIITSKESHPFIEQIAARLRERPEMPVSNEDLARECGFSTGHFIRLFKQYKGCTPHHYHLRALMEKAAVLLHDTSMTVQEVAFTLGIEDPLYFSRSFRSVHGVPPREYRKQNK